MHNEINTVIFGDAIDILDKFPEEFADCVITDFLYKSGKQHLIWMNEICYRIKRILKPNSNFVFYPGTKELPEKLNLIQQHFSYNWPIICYKPTFRHFGKTGFTKMDMIFWFSKGKGRVYKKSPDIIVDRKEKTNEYFGFKHYKGIEVTKKLIEIFTAPDHLVIDPFCGTGSILVACKMLKRKFIGIDKDFDMIELAKKRLNKIEEENEK